MLSSCLLAELRTLLDGGAQLITAWIEKNQMTELTVAIVMAAFFDRPVDDRTDAGIAYVISSEVKYPLERRVLYMTAPQNIPIRSFTFWFFLINRIGPAKKLQSQISVMLQALPEVIT
ncbi:hypothetical protein [Pantoea sp. App145]|uniref:hypothetical protein n=1 Tax=Pantoea sp. App145 TaxID=3071567 RepID=UPI003A80F865